MSQASGDPPAGRVAAPATDARVGRAPAFDRVLDRWQQLKGDRRWPARREITAPRFHPHLPALFLVDILSASPLRVYYRLVGTRLVGAFCRDPTGRTLDEMPFLFRRLARRGYAALLARQGPCFDRVTVLEGAWPIRYDRLMLPLGETDARIDGVLGMIDLLGDALPPRPAPYLRR
jgi:hypothetical protein